MSLCDLYSVVLEIILYGIHPECQKASQGSDEYLYNNAFLQMKGCYFDASECTYAYKNTIHPECQKASQGSDEYLFNNAFSQMKGCYFDASECTYAYKNTKLNRLPIIHVPNTTAYTVIKHTLATVS